MKSVAKNTFFKPEFMHAVVNAPTLAEAKEEAIKAVEAGTDKKGVNTRKAMYMIATVKTHKNLIMGITNFFLGYEGLYVLK